MLKQLGLVFFIVNVSFALGQGGFRGGLAAGVSTSQIGGDGYSGFDKAGIAIGGFLNSSFKNESFDWQFEIMYLDKGSRQPPNYDQGIGYKEIRLSYVEVPLLIKYHYRKFVFDMGFSYGRLVRHKEFDDNGELLFPSTFKPYEVGFLIDINYVLIKNLIMNVRFSNSLLAVRDFAIISRFGPAGGSYNNVLMYTVRYEFGKKKTTNE